MNPSTHGPPPTMAHHGPHGLRQCPRLVGTDHRGGRQVIHGRDLHHQAIALGDAHRAHLGWRIRDPCCWTPRWGGIFMWKRTSFCPKNPGKTLKWFFGKPWESLVKHYKLAGYSMLQYPLCRAADLENSGSSNLRSAGNHGSSQSSNRGVQSSGC